MPDANWTQNEAEAEAGAHSALSFLSPPPSTRIPLGAWGGARGGQNSKPHLPVQFHTSSDMSDSTKYVIFSKCHRSGSEIVTLSYLGWFICGLWEKSHWCHACMSLREEKQPLQLMKQQIALTLIVLCWGSHYFPLLTSVAFPPWAPDFRHSWKTDLWEFDGFQPAAEPLRVHYRKFALIYVEWLLPGLLWVTRAPAGVFVLFLLQNNS